MFSGLQQKTCIHKELTGPLHPTTSAFSRVQSPLYKSWNISSFTKWHSTTLQLPGGLPHKMHRGPVLSTVADIERIPIKIRNVRYPTERRKAVTCYSVDGTRILLPQGSQRTSTSHHTWLWVSLICPVKELESQLLNCVATCYFPAVRKPAAQVTQRTNTSHCVYMLEVPSLLSRSSKSSSYTEWYSAKLQMLLGLPTTVHRDPPLPLWLQESLWFPMKGKNPVPSLMGEKRWSAPQQVSSKG
jgi:hypothetical protein